MPWQPPSTVALVGSISTAKSPASQSGLLRGDPAEAVLVRLDLLVVVEDVGHVAVGLGQVGGQPELHGDAALHVGGAAAVDPAALDPARQVAAERHRVDVAGEDDPLGAAQRRARDDGVAVAVDGQVRYVAQRPLDQVGQRRLVAADRLDVAQGDGQVGAGQGQVESGHGPEPYGPKTQNSLPAGSASTCQSMSSSGPRRRVAPRRTSSSTSSLTTSQCHRFLTVFGSSTPTNFQTSHGSPGTSASQRRVPSGASTADAPRTSAHHAASALRVGRVDDERAGAPCPAGKTHSSLPSGSASTVQRKLSVWWSSSTRPPASISGAVRRQHEVEVHPVLDRLRLRDRVEPHGLLRLRTAQHDVAGVLRLGRAGRARRPRTAPRRPAGRRRGRGPSIARVPRARTLSRSGRLSPMSSPAHGTGVLTRHSSGQVLDVWYPDPQLGEPGLPGDGPELQHLVGDDDARDVVRELVTTVVDLDAAPADTADVWLRLHLLSHRLVRPREADLTGVFGLLTNVVWTNHGPCAVEGFELTRSRLQRRGPVTVLGVDKFPRMVDYVLPPGCGSPTPTGSASGRTSRPAPP